MHAIILAGGGGTRLWPLSREDFPKQFLNFGDSESLLQKTVRRFLHSDLIDEIVISTNVHYEALVIKQLEKMDLDRKVHILVEPNRKNTAPAIAFTIKFLQEQLGALDSDPVLVLPSDHLIEPEAVFMRYVDHVRDVVRTEQIVTFGIKPTRPETGYGYIKIGVKLDPFTHRVQEFVEKPDRARAEEYLASGNYYWNAGMFAFSIHTFWTELQNHAPAIFLGMQRTFQEIIDGYHLLPDISIDYALMEKTARIAICPLPVHWSDIGSWDSVYEILKKDQNRNVIIGNVIALETKNSLIMGGKRLISTVGLEDLLIVETEDALFISKKGESQRVKALVQELNRSL
ncbi:MAG TPA: mannose-1-phosphate guanylyltransferase [Chlamydiales bacterium]|nr:mannose-1-phosphate guanylyltransferase [Chlamydiales bacterium]